MRALLFRYLALALLLILSGCQSQPRDSAFVWDYFPLAVGNYWVYRVVETGQIFETKIVQRREIDKRIYFEIENLPEFGQYSQITPARRWIRYDAQAHQMLEHLDERERILLDLEALLSTKFPLTLTDRTLANQNLPYGSFDDRSEQGNCAYNPTCSLGRTLFVQNIGVVAHARFPNRPRRLAEYTYYLKEAMINGVYHPPYFTENVNLTWNEQLTKPYKTCSPASRFEPLSRREWKFSFAAPASNGAAPGIMNIINANYRFGPFPAPGTPSVQLGKLDFDVSYDRVNSSAQLTVKLSSRRAVENARGSYVIMVGAESNESAQMYLCYLFIEP